MFARISTRTFLWVLACVACVVGRAPAARGQEAQVEVLPLEQAVALALGENRQVKSASIEVEKYSDRLAALRTRRLPEFKFNTLASQLLTPMSFTFEQGAFGSYQGIGPIPNKTTEISTPRRLTFYVNSRSSRRTCLTSLTWTCGCRKTRRSPRRTRPPFAPKK
jgi:hypothetical protein